MPTRLSNNSNISGLPVPVTDRDRYIVKLGELIKEGSLDIIDAITALCACFGGVPPIAPDVVQCTYIPTDPCAGYVSPSLPIFIAIFSDPQSINVPLGLIIGCTYSIDIQNNSPANITVQVDGGIPQVFTPFTGGSFLIVATNTDIIVDTGGGVGQFIEILQVNAILTPPAPITVNSQLVELSPCSDVASETTLLNVITAINNNGIPANAIESCTIPLIIPIVESAIKIIPSYCADMSKESTLSQLLILTLESNYRNYALTTAVTYNANGDIATETFTSIYNVVVLTYAYDVSFNLTGITRT